MAPRYTYWTIILPDGPTSFRARDRDSLVHRLDPRTKLVAVFLFILAVALTSPAMWPGFAVYFVVMAGLVLLSRVPVRYVLKRSLVIIPFVVLIAVFIPFFKEGEVAGSYNIWLWQVSVTHSGLQVFWNVLAKAWLSILALITLTATTKITDLLRGLEQLRLPRVMVMILSFMYRYIFVLTDEVMRMKQARDSRNFGSGRRLWQIKTVGSMTGTLFIRSDGQSRPPDGPCFRAADMVFGLSFGAAVVLTCIFSFLYQVI